MPPRSLFHEDVLNASNAGDARFSRFLRNFFPSRFAVKPAARSEEIRWQLLKAMLDEFPTLQSKTREYLQEKEMMDKCRAIS